MFTFKSSLAAEGVGKRKVQNQIIINHHKFFSGNQDSKSFI